MGTIHRWREIILAIRRSHSKSKASVKITQEDYQPDYDLDMDFLARDQPWT